MVTILRMAILSSDVFAHWAAFLFCFATWIAENLLHVPIKVDCRCPLIFYRGLPILGRTGDILCVITYF